MYLPVILLINFPLWSFKSYDLSTCPSFWFRHHKRHALWTAGSETVVEVPAWFHGTCILQRNIFIIYGVPKASKLISFQIIIYLISIPVCYDKRHTVSPQIGLKTELRFAYRSLVMPQQQIRFTCYMNWHPTKKPISLNAALHCAQIKIAKITLEVLNTKY